MATSATAAAEGVETAGQRSDVTAMTRRRLLAGTGQVALLAMMLPTACAPTANTPWADGTFWDDGQGWAA